MATTTTSVDELETQISNLKKELAELRQSLPHEPVRQYTFKTHEGDEVSLADLFGDKDDLIVIHNMGTGCVYCTLWADGLNSLTSHLENRAAFVVTSPDKVERQKPFHASRGWTFRMVSSEGTTFFKDMGFEKEGEAWPGVSTFRRENDGSITRVSSAFFGPGDEYCVAWSLLDLLANGAADWEPKFAY